MCNKQEIEKVKTFWKSLNKKTEELGLDKDVLDDSLLNSFSTKRCKELLNHLINTVDHGVLTEDQIKNAKDLLEGLQSNYDSYKEDLKKLKLKTEEFKQLSEDLKGHIAEEFNLDLSDVDQKFQEFCTHFPHLKKAADVSALNKTIASWQNHIDDIENPLQKQDEQKALYLVGSQAYIEDLNKKLVLS